MELSILVAKVISAIYLSSGIAVLINRLNFDRVTEDMKNSPALTFFGGALGIILGTALVHYHNIWTGDWRVLITLISWGMFLGGVAVVIFPDSISYMRRFYKHSPLWGVFMIGIGLLFGYFGYLS